MRLRGRLALALAAVALLTTVLTIGGAALLTAHAATGRAYDALDRQAEAVATSLGPGGGEAGAQRAFVLRGGRATRVKPGSALGRALAGVGSSATRGRVDTGKRELIYVRVRPAGVAPLVLARAPGNADPDLGPFRRALLVAAIAGALLAALAGLLIARRLTRPLTALSAAARRVGAGERGASVDVGREDEIGELAMSFNAMSAELAAAEDAEKRFLRSVSHELRTPLAALRAQGEALTDGALGGDVAGPVVVREAMRLERLVGDLLALGALGAPGFHAADDPVDLAAVAEAVCRREAPRAQALGVELGRVGDEPAVARGDAGRLEQAVTNLVDNALRATPPGGRVTLGVAPGELTVVDTGPGLADEDLPRAFERFHLHERYRERRGEEAGGSGLGLALVRELCEAMGAEVSAGHASGGGARFTVRLREHAP